MRVNCLSTIRPIFKGKVYQNYYDTVKNIVNCPYHTIDGVIGNLIMIKKELERTPDSERYVLDFKYNPYVEGEFINHQGTVTIKDKNSNALKQNYNLGKTLKSRRIFYNSEEFCKNGFQDIVNKALANSFDGPLETDDDYRYACKDTAQIRTSYDIYSPELKSIASRIEDRAKVKMDKPYIAAQICELSFNCSDELIDTIVDDVNTLTRRLEEETPELSTYKFHAYYKHVFTGFEWIKGIGFVVDADMCHTSESQQGCDFLLPIEPEDAHAMFSRFADRCLGIPLWAPFFANDNIYTDGKIYYELTHRNVENKRRIWK